MKSFITGSNAYGKPSKNSDVDLVILGDDNLKEFLKAKSESSKSIRFGKLNIIVCEDETEYSVWKLGTEHLSLKKKKVDKNVATKFFDGLRKLVGIKDSYSKSDYDDEGCEEYDDDDDYDDDDYDATPF